MSDTKTPAATPAKANPATQPKDLTTFYVKKGRVSNLLGGIQAMQKRDDITGKFARKLTQIARVLRTTVEALMEEEKALQELHKDKFPEGHPQAGEVKPVYAVDNDGKSIFKKDASNNDTEEREIVPGSFNFKDPVAYQKDRLEMLKEYVVIECPCFRVTDPDGKDDKFVPELDRFGKVNGAAWDACADFEEGSPATTRPADLDGVADPAPVASGPAVDVQEDSAP